MSLADNACVPCKGGTPPLDLARQKELLQDLKSGWLVNDRGHLECKYTFKNFISAMEFANIVADIAEAENHHPDLTVRWGQCQIEMWTHKISGLTESDFYFAAKTERAYQNLYGQ